VLLGRVEGVHGGGGGVEVVVEEAGLSIPRNRRDFFVRILRFSDLER